MSILPHFYNDKQITQTSEDTVLAGRMIPKGYCNATEICKVNGKRWVKYMEFSKTPAFLKALNEVSPPGGLTHIITVTEGSNELRGTWVSLPVAMNLAQWCSPEFAAWASVVLAAIVKGHYDALEEEAEIAQAKLKGVWKEIRRSGINTRRSLTDSCKDWYARNPNGSTRPMGVMIAQTTNLIYQALWGMDAMQLETHLGCGRHDARNHLSAPDLRHLDSAEERVSEYIDEDNIKPVEAVKLANLRKKQPPQHR